MYGGLEPGHEWFESERKPAVIDALHDISGPADTFHDLVVDW